MLSMVASASRGVICNRILNVESISSKCNMEESKCKVSCNTNKNMSAIRSKRKLREQ